MNRVIQERTNSHNFTKN